MAAMTVGQVPPRRVAGEQRVERGIAQQLEREREAVGRACGCLGGAGATIPTWLERIVRRREWKSPPSVQTAPGGRRTSSPR